MIRFGGAAAADAGTKRNPDYEPDILATMADRSLVRFDAEGTRIDPTIGASEGETLAGPNDISRDGDGFYFTDSGPDYDPWPVADGVEFLNGIAQSPNGGTLYIAESLGNRNRLQRRTWACHR